MTQIIIEDPDLYERKEVDGSGRIYLGKEWAGKRVKVVVETDDEAEDEEGNAKLAAVAAD